MNDLNTLNEIDVLNNIDNNLVFIEGFFLFIIILLLCYVVYKFFNIFFK